MIPLDTEASEFRPSKRDASSPSIGPRRYGFSHRESRTRRWRLFHHRRHSPAVSRGARRDRQRPRFSKTVGRPWLRRRFALAVDDSIDRQESSRQSSCTCDRLRRGASYFRRLGKALNAPLTKLLSQRVGAISPTHHVQRFDGQRVCRKKSEKYRFSLKNMIKPFAYMHSLHRLGYVIPC